MDKKEMDNVAKTIYIILGAGALYYYDVNMMDATYNNEFLNTGKYLVGYGLAFILFEVIKHVAEDFLDEESE